MPKLCEPAPNCRSSVRNFVRFFVKKFRSGFGTELSMVLLTTVKSVQSVMKTGTTLTTLVAEPLKNISVIAA